MTGEEIEILIRQDRENLDRGLLTPEEAHRRLVALTIKKIVAKYSE